ncbi:MAG TPA: FAD-dependent monooxygenase [Isosphaeraceae bacterium]|nr:FAD-dependent monooxygenase [Isosphaeraceae bacterium]
MSVSETPIIVGAGPVGLGAALFLTRQGQAVRVVEMKDEPSPWSKALAVSPRTLDILEPTGLTQKMLDLGRPIVGMRFERGGKRLAEFDLGQIHPRYPFMLALSQATTERLLFEALQEAGGGIERGLKMVECRPEGQGVEVALEPTDGGERSVARYPWLLAAEGVHSVARKQLGIAFEGSNLRDEWYLADVPLKSELSLDHGYIFFQKDGAFLFMLPVVDGTPEEQGRDQVWRILGNRPDPLSQVERSEPTGPPKWSSSFHVAHRLNATLAKDGVYFAGDSAHVHSPVGARGMNLGLEDAWVFSELVRTGRLSDYNRLRRPVDHDVVKRVERISRMAAAETPAQRLVRRFVFPLVAAFPQIRSRMVMAITGLDHDLPSFPAAEHAPGGQAAR